MMSDVPFLKHIFSCCTSLRHLKCFGNPDLQAILCKTKPKDNISVSLNSQRFAFRANTSTKEAISNAFNSFSHTFIQHLHWNAAGLRQSIQNNLPQQTEWKTKHSWLDSHTLQSDTGLTKQTPFS